MGQKQISRTGSVKKEQESIIKPTKKENSNTQNNKKEQGSDKDKAKKQNTPKNTYDFKNDPDAYYSSIVNSWNRKDYDDFLKRYPDSEYSQEIRKRKAEIDLWDNTVKENTTAAFKVYLNNTEYGRHNEDAENRIAALSNQEKKNATTGWARATRINTLDAYSDFINTYPDSPYVEEARKRIKSLDTEREWKELMETHDVYTYRSFLREHPEYPDRKVVEDLIYAEEALQNYKNGDIEGAYKSFSSINDNRLLDNERFEKAYIVSKEYHLYHTFDSKTDPKIMKQFLQEFPYSQYKASVENYLALSLANKFNSYSSQKDYEEALSYAKDEETRNLIEGLIEQNKEKNKKTFMIRH